MFISRRRRQGYRPVFAQLFDREGEEYDPVWNCPNRRSGD
jgi:hypothetical protein